ncbi:MAG: (d)CMP kinase [Pseudomonadales bacterium]|nr:(d)CMP kinase [Pseudomonadales bacterium]
MNPLADKSVLIIGLGLIGGSVARGLRERGLCRRILACGRDSVPLERARSEGVIDAWSTDLSRIAPEADLVLIAVPTLSMRPLLQILRAHCTPGCVITDAASVKGSVVADVRAVYGELPARFVPGHPIAGSERSGYDASVADLYCQRKVILTPAQGGDEAALALVCALWQGLGAEVSLMSVEDHDAVLAATSHLPHLLAFSLVNTLSAQTRVDDIFRYAAGGFAGFTRIAGSDPVMWRDIFLANAEATVAMLDAYTAELAQMRQAVQRGDGECLEQAFRQAQSARNRFIEQHYSRKAPVPVLTIDGPGGSGKGTISARVAQALGWHYLDSGALYRLLGLAAQAAGVSTGDAEGLLTLLLTLDIRFSSSDGSVWLNGEEVSDELRQESAGALASEVAVIPQVREALLARQHDFRQAPGLVADGRDMGTVVFPDAPVKVYLTATPEERAKRRYKQLIAKGIDVNLSALFLDIRARDERDSNRAVSPLKPAEDAIVVDTTELSIDQVVDKVLEMVREAGLTQEI